MSPDASFEAETILQQLEASSSSGSTGRALPVDCYLSPAFFELECEKLLRPGWHAVGRHDELPNSGDFRVIDVVGERVLLVRDSAGMLRALRNLPAPRVSNCLWIGQHQTLRVSLPSLELRPRRPAEDSAADGRRRGLRS